VGLVDQTQQLDCDIKDIKLIKEVTASSSEGPADAALTTWVARSIVASNTARIGCKKRSIQNTFKNAKY